MKEFFKTIKVNFLLASILYIVLGLVLLVWPHTSSSIICAGFGIFLLLYGAITIISFFVHESRTGFLRFELILGILFAALGVFFLVRPDAVLSVLPVMLGIYIIIDALLNLKRAQELQRMAYSRWWVILVTSLISAVLGVVILWNPLFLSDFIFRIVGVVLIYTGLSDLWSLFKLGRVTKVWRADHPIEVDPIDIE